MADKELQKKTGNEPVLQQLGRKWKLLWNKLMTTLPRKHYSGQWPRNTWKGDVDNRLHVELEVASRTELMEPSNL